MVSRRPARWRPWAGDLGRRSLLVALVPLLLAVTAILLLLYVLAQSRHADDEVQRGLRALGQIHAVHAALAEAASGVRGFIITRDETFLRPYERAQQQLREALRRLDEDIRDPVQRGQLEEIYQLVDVKLSNLAVLVSLSRGLSDDQILVYSRSNKALLDRLRRGIVFMENRENQIIADLKHQQQRTRQIGHASALVAVLATCVLASLLSQWFAASLIRRIRHLRDNARRIVSGEPLQPFQDSAEDELAELDALLVQTGETLYQKLDELEAARQASERASEAKSRFLSRTSHELRTPLNAILGFSAVLQKQIREPAQRRQLETVRQSAEHLLNLVNDLLDMSRVEAGQLLLKDEALNLRDQLERALEIVQGRAAAREIRLRFEHCDNLPPVRGDAGRVLQVLINLLDNAAKFARGGSEVVVRAEQHDGGVSLHIIDQGPGIPAEFQTELFRPFSRQREQHEGAGLGLAISHGLMQAMGGTLSFRPGSTGGSCFALWLRISDEEPAAPALLPPLPSVAAARESRPRLLVVQSSDGAFMTIMETIAQRLAIPCVRWDQAVEQGAKSREDGYLLLRDADPVSPRAPVWVRETPPRVLIWRGDPGPRDRAGTDCKPGAERVMPRDAPASAWRALLQEILDEQQPSFPA